MQMILAYREGELPEGEVERVSMLVPHVERMQELLSEMYPGITDWKFHVRDTFKADVPERIIHTEVAPFRLPVVSCEELYAMEPVRVSGHLYHLLNPYHNHVPEVEDCDIEYDYGEDDPYIEVRYLATDVRDGGEWDLALATVWFKGEPVMVVQHAGDTHQNRFITHPDRYDAMVAYLQTLRIDKKDPKLNDVVPLDQKIRALTDFAGYPEVRLLRPEHSDKKS